MMWTKTMQCAVGIFVLTIVAGAFYRPASMYHPRRKMIMHIKNQKKTRRDQEEVDPPYFDFSALRMRGLQALMIISSIAAFGIFVPFIILVKTILRFKLVKICNFTDYCYTCLFFTLFSRLKKQSLIVWRRGFDVSNTNQHIIIWDFCMHWNVVYRLFVPHITPDWRHQFIS